jgi:hypothetical protein
MQRQTNRYVIVKLGTASSQIRKYCSTVVTYMLILVLNLDVLPTVKE